MKLIILGGPVVGKVNVDVTPDKPFGEVFALIQAAVDKGALWDKFQLNVAEVRDRKVRATTRVIQSTDTAESLGLSSDAAVLILRPLDRNMSGGPTVADRVTDTNSTPPKSTQCDYRSRMIAIYQKYEPSKVGTVDASLQKFKGKEEAVIRQLVKKYGPEPDAANTDFPQSPPNNDVTSPIRSIKPQTFQGAETREETPVSPLVILKALELYTLLHRHWRPRIVARESGMSCWNPRGKLWLPFHPLL
ncbi:hypothetical protein C4B63_48g164 [Trypanosoma cruzi]|uniref:Uncharacterized protein n=1 Tax=Trypanosoma cruzi TaxID=5693 RepID=A0A2V2V3F5_TRYCR|nr:hypothetical protein C4B63_48g164 [Trypanosoma cruzi]